MFPAQTNHIFKCWIDFGGWWQYFFWATKTELEYPAGGNLLFWWEVFGLVWQSLQPFFILCCSYVDYLFFSYWLLEGNGGNSDTCNLKMPVPSFTSILSLYCILFYHIVIFGLMVSSQIAVLPYTLNVCFPFLGATSQLCEKKPLHGTWRKNTFLSEWPQKEETWQRDG